MTTASSRELLKSMAEKLLLPEPDFLTMKQSVDGMYEMFKAITGISCENMNDQEIILPKGKAISPAAAAHCLLEMKRTTVFLRGIHEAIRHQQRRMPNKTLHILYAGTGPYATLITPLLPMFTPEELQVDLLDINKISLEAAVKTVEAFELGQFIRRTWLADATSFQIEAPYDIIISETMQNCLHNEPQVFIMQNLISQMNSKSIFIPEEISVDAFLTSPALEREQLNSPPELQQGARKIFLGNVFKVNKFNYNPNLLGNEIDIPAMSDGFTELKLFTTVTVFEDEKLSNNDSSITLPKKFYEFREPYARKIKFWLNVDSMPKIDCKITEYVTDKVVLTNH